MDTGSSLLSSIISIGGLLGTVVTAIATIFLWRVTQILAKETKRMADASAQPHVVATLTPNKWSMRHFDLHIDNTGNATAYDITVAFDPPLENGDGRTRLENVPLQNVSVLKPGQGLSSYLAEYTLLEGNVYRVSISWKRNAADLDRQSNAYTINMADGHNVTRLGEEDPLILIANSVKKIREDWEQVARGNKRTKVDAFSSLDRLHEQRVSGRQRRAWKRNREAAKAEQDKASQLSAEQAPTSDSSES